MITNYLFFLIALPKEELKKQLLIILLFFVFIMLTYLFLNYLKLKFTKIFKKALNNYWNHLIYHIVKS